MSNKENSINTLKVYDSVFWNTARVLKDYLPYLVNEAFGEKYTKNAEVTFKADKEVVSKEDGTTVTAYVDALFNILDKQYSSGGCDIHFECETKGSKGIYIRIAKYVSGYAYENVVETEIGAKIIIPYSAVIFLRRDSKKICKFVITVECPGGELSYNVPVLKISDYSLDEIFEKKLLVLLPFLPFMFTQNELKTMDNDEERRKQIELLILDIDRRLMKMVDNNELKNVQKGVIINNLLLVFEKIAVKYETIRKEVEDMRKIKVYKSEIEEAWEQAEAKAEAMAEAKAEAMAEAKAEAMAEAKAEAIAEAKNKELADKEMELEEQKQENSRLTEKIENQKEENSKLTQKIEMLQNILKKNNIAVF